MRISPLFVESPIFFTSHQIFLDQGLSGLILRDVNPWRSNIYGDLNNFRILSATSQMRLFNGKYGEEIKLDVKNRP